MLLNYARTAGYSLHNITFHAGSKSRTGTKQRTGCGAGAFRRRGSAEAGAADAGSHARGNVLTTIKAEYGVFSPLCLSGAIWFFCWVIKAQGIFACRVVPMHIQVFVVALGVVFCSTVFLRGISIRSCSAPYNYSFRFHNFCARCCISSPHLTSPHLTSPHVTSHHITSRFSVPLARPHVQTKQRTGHAERPNTCLFRLIAGVEAHGRECRLGGRRARWQREVFPFRSDTDRTPEWLNQEFNSMSKNLRCFQPSAPKNAARWAWERRKECLVVHGFQEYILYTAWHAALEDERLK